MAFLRKQSKNKIKNKNKKNITFKESKIINKKTINFEITVDLNLIYEKILFPL